jgi:hypothetical protein
LLLLMNATRENRRRTFFRIRLPGRGRQKPAEVQFGGGFAAAGKPRLRAIGACMNERTSSRPGLPLLKTVGSFGVHRPSFTPVPLLAGGALHTLPKSTDGPPRCARRSHRPRGVGPTRAD